MIMMRNVISAIVMPLLPSLAMALTPLADDDLAGVAGHDGLMVDLQTQTSADQLRWITDGAGVGGCEGGTSNQHACTILRDITLEAAAGGPARMTIGMDVGSDAGSAPWLALQAAWEPQRLVLGGLTLQTAAADYASRSLGQIALYSEGTLNWLNREGLFNSLGDYASFDLDSSGDIIYRQGDAGRPELSFADLMFSMYFSSGAASGHVPQQGRVALTGSGMELGGQYANVNLTFDLAFKAQPDGFDRSGRSGIVYFGWQGGLVAPLQRLGGGGFGYNSYTLDGWLYQDYDGSRTGARSEGLSLLSEWDFDSDFELVIGEAQGNRTYAGFGDWRRFGGSSGPAFSFPVIFDVIQNGVGPAGLCAGPFASGVPSESSCIAEGGEWFPSGVPVGSAAFAALIRDARLLAYSTGIRVVDPQASGGVTPINWGVLFTYGKLDADIFLYPQGRADGAILDTTDTGIRADITFLAQSPDAWRRANSSSASVRASATQNWRTNTHVMVADTSSALVPSGLMGVGFMNGDIIYRARDLFLRVTDGDSAYPALPGGLWLQTDSLAQYRFRGIFGGGDLTDLSYGNVVKISLIDVNLQTNKFIFALNPLPVDAITGAAPMGFNGLLDFDGGSYITVGEVSSPQSQFFVRDVGGRIAWRDGSLAIVSGQNTSDSLPQLAIRNTLDIGQSAGFGGTGGQPLIGTVGFGTENFGRLAIPAGTWNSEVILKIPN
jgi:hypothetical protein